MGGCNSSGCKLAHSADERCGKRLRNGAQAIASSSSSSSCSSIPTGRDTNSKPQEEVKEMLKNSAINGQARTNWHPEEGENEAPRTGASERGAAGERRATRGGLESGDEEMAHKRNEQVRGKFIGCFRARLKAVRSSWHARVTLSGC